ncbi:hypothetical protein DM806_00110 [Sphingobium lactosutens]|uniref:hypothetical protein n=1 Tax=Sphingobium lactosutens TaxID=522773 RepID=UPI0015BDBE00|nr:hypothetical protein [Sphingobium lactosutens]NWK94122.1 hypothetical protein [Sphingobium lactosutens]
MMLALAGGCRASDDGAQADNGVPTPPLVAAAPDNAVPPPPAPPVTPPKPGPIVTVRAQPAPYFPLDLPPSDVAASAAPFPREVTEFMVARDGCDHFRGEEPYDAERRAYIEESIAELCQGTDAKLAMLRRRYAGDPSVISALKGYEDRIEAPQSY